MVYMICDGIITKCEVVKETKGQYIIKSNTEKGVLHLNKSQLPKIDSFVHIKVYGTSKKEIRDAYLFELRKRLILSKQRYEFLENMYKKSLDMLKKEKF